MFFTMEKSLYSEEKTFFHGEKSLLRGENLFPRKYSKTRLSRYFSDQHFYVDI